jgi:hypothetical protein
MQEGGDIAQHAADRGGDGIVTSPTAITDEFAPFFWHGPNAVAD